MSPSPPPPWLTRLFWVKTFGALGMLAGFLLSPKLWLSDRFYPLAPVSDLLPTIPPPWDTVWFVSLLILLASIAVWPRPRVLIWVFIGLAGLLALWDQTRWQPWFYQYLFLLAACGWRRLDQSPDDGESALNVCRFIVASTYFWSGLQKLNPGFTGYALPWLLQPLGIHIGPDEAIPTWLVVAGWVAALTESAIGLGLLFRPLRSVAIPLALGMHFFLMTVLGPFGHNWNTIVWPWNVVMILLVLILFTRSRAVDWRAIVWPGRAVFHAVVVLLFGVMPLFSFWGLWDQYFSAALYSGSTLDGYVEMTPTVLDRLPPMVQDNVGSGDFGLWQLDLASWSMNELNVPPNPERRVYLAVARGLLPLTDNPNDIGLLIQERPNWWTGVRPETWYDGQMLTEK